MKYVGSKNRIAKELAPVIQSYITENTVGYLEPFVGGANMIDKIKCKYKSGFDIHQQLIALLQYAQDLDNKIPPHISEDEYNRVRLLKDLDGVLQTEPDWYIGLVGFCATFSAKYFGGYARSFKADGITPRDMSGEAIKNLEKQRKDLVGIDFRCRPFQLIPTNAYEGWVIYCDIPYRDTTKYTTGGFPYEEFYEWAIEMSKNNIVLISEYNMPEDKFECVWSKEHKVLIDSNKNSGDESNIRIEKLFKVR